MNKSKFIWGIICLAIGILLTALVFVLPEDKMVFMVGGVNAPGIPAVALIVIGIVLMVSARNEDPAEKAEAEEFEIDEGKAALNKRMETTAWGLFLIMLGGFAFVPHEQVPPGVWSIGVGLIMLGLNAGRYFNQIKMSGFTTVLGLLSVIGGALELAGLTSMEGGILLVILGSYLIVKPRIEQQQLFGKAEEA